MSNATAIRVGPARRALSKSYGVPRPPSPPAIWSPPPKEMPSPREWRMVTSPALAWAMVQILVDRPPKDGHL